MFWFVLVCFVLFWFVLVAKRGGRKGRGLRDSSEILVATFGGMDSVICLASVIMIMHWLCGGEV